VRVEQRQEQAERFGRRRLEPRESGLDRCFVVVLRLGLGKDTAEEETLVDTRVGGRCSASTDSASLAVLWGPVRRGVNPTVLSVSTQDIDAARATPRVKCDRTTGKKVAREKPDCLPR
jgi:hypothetical protein